MSSALIGKLTNMAIVFIGIFVVGTFGYSFLEDWDIIEALFFTLITLTTIGYGEIHPLSDAGRIFTIFIIISGLGLTLYGISSVTQLLVEGELKIYFRNRKMKNIIKKLSGHYVICGFGRIGSMIGEELEKNHLPFVVIEKDEDVIERLKEHNIPYIEGDATEDENLDEANIMKAAGLIISLEKDSDNVFVALSARGKNPELYILSKCDHLQTERKLITAGANKVVMPYHLGGKRMANMLLKPNVVEFIDMTLGGDHYGLVMTELKLGKKCSLNNKSLIDSGLRQKYNIIVVGVIKKGSDLVYNPASTYVLEENDILIVLGPQDSIQNLKEQENYF